MHSSINYNNPKDRWIKPNVVNILVLFICKGSNECFNPYFKISNSPSPNLVPDRFSTASSGVKGLKYGLKHSIEHLHINKTDLLITFDFIHRSISKDLKHKKDAGEVKVKVSFLANNHVNANKPSKNPLRK